MGKNPHEMKGVRGVWYGVIEGLSDGLNDYGNKYVRDG